MNPRFLLAAAAGAVLLCAHPAAAQTDTIVSHPPADTAPTHAPARPAHHDRLRITLDEIQGHPEANALLLIRALRPAWLRGDMTANTGFSNLVGVQVDGGPPSMGEDELRQISLENVKELRFVPANEAVQMFGRDYTSGAILITTH